MKIDYNIPENLNSYGQVVADIAMVADTILHHTQYYDYDSVRLSMAIADYAREFEEAWKTLALNDDYMVDYFDLVTAYANRKLGEFFQDVPYEKAD